MNTKGVALAFRTFPKKVLSSWTTWKHNAASLLDEFERSGVSRAKFAAPARINSTPANVDFLAFLSYAKFSSCLPKMVKFSFGESTKSSSHTRGYYCSSKRRVSITSSRSG